MAPKTKTPWLNAGLSVFSVVLTLALLEIVFQLKYRAATGRWVHDDEPVAEVRALIQRHPILGTALRPNAKIEMGGHRFTHSANGTRGPAFSREVASGKKRIVVIDGSTAYGVLVDDEDTFPAKLQKRLADCCEIINLAVPGYGTLEGLIQTNFYLSDLKPNVVIYLEGWNDARNFFVKDLAPDYSNYHARAVAAAQDKVEKVSLSDYSALAKSIFARLGSLGGNVVVDATDDKFTDKRDERVLSLYARNLSLMATAARKLGVKPLFVPQRMNPAKLTADTPYGWLPFVRDRDVPKIMDYMNETMSSVAKKENVPYAERVLREDFDPSDFVDQGHLSGKGAEKLSALLVQYLEPLL